MHGAEQDVLVRVGPMPKSAVAHSEARDQFWEQPPRFWVLNGRANEGLAQRCCPRYAPAILGTSLVAPAPLLAQPQRPPLTRLVLLLPAGPGLHLSAQSRGPADVRPRAVPGGGQGGGGEQP